MHKRTSRIVVAVIGLLPACGGRNDVVRGHDRNPASAVSPSQSNGGSVGWQKDTDAALNCGGGRPRDDGTCAPPDGMPCLFGCDDRTAETEADRDARQNGPELDRVAIDRALGRVDLSSCRAGKSVRGHATIILMPSGRVGHVRLDLLEPSTDEVRRCVLQQYYAVHVTAFHGPSVTVGRSF
jgi:hypothetical protein